MISLLVSILVARNLFDVVPTAVDPNGPSVCAQSIRLVTVPMRSLVPLLVDLGSSNQIPCNTDQILPQKPSVLL